MDDCEVFLRQLRENDPDCQSLDLFSNDLGDAGAEKVAMALCVNRVCTYLSLWTNDIGKKGADALATALQSNSTLRELDLNTNDLGPEGCEAIAMALNDNSTLTALHMDGNKVGDNGAISWGLVLESNKTLRCLDLVDNEITDEGAEAILMGLENNNTITKLNLSENPISEKLLQEIEERVAVNRAKAGDDADLPAAPVPRATVAVRVPTPELAAAAAAGPAVDLEDYVPIEEFDRLFDDYEKLKAKCKELERQLAGVEKPPCERCEKLEDEVRQLKVDLETEQEKVAMLEGMMLDEEA